ncbi:MAG TPA: hypothetical protein VN924_09295 [Bryobacteraceae bacterium]|nr:hypothetical protein [Bryobacteraceae bacterium]
MPENEPIRRLEHLMGVLAEKQVRLDGVLGRLRGAQIKTEEQFRDTDWLSCATDERSRDLDARVERLVVAIGEFLRNKLQ